jgi:hypothetical protein
MSYRVYELPRAIADVQHIARWLARRTIQGSAAWMRAYDEMVVNVSRDASRFAAAPETHPEFVVRQALFKTRKGRVYRALFFIDGDDVYILRVRGPGQAKVKPNDLR